MQQPADSENTRKKQALGVGALLLAVLAIFAAVTWPGYDAQITPEENPNLWVIRSGSAEQYGRVNTEVLELETVKPAANPSSIIQHDDTTIVFVDGNRRFTVLDPAMPADLEAEADEKLVASPDDTRSATLGGETLLFITANGALYTAPVDSPTGHMPLNPDADVEVEEGEQAPVFLADTATITSSDTVLAVHQETPTDARLIIADGITGKVKTDELVEVTLGDRPQIAEVDGKWVILNRSSGELWVEGESDPVTLGVDTSPTLRTSGGGPILVADAEGLLEVDAKNGSTERTVSVPLGSKPAQPTQIGDDVYAAWLTDDDVGGTLWSMNEDATKVLDYGGLGLEGDPDPRFITNGSRSALTDSKSGWVWTVPDGYLVPSSQDWNQDDDIVEDVITAEVKEVTEPKPPVAEPDSFGVRAGADAILPVLLNDHDPNNDILSIIPESLTGLDPEFGSLTLSNDFQQIVVAVQKEASGSATFTYQVTDGTTAEGLKSNKATVTLTVIPEDSNAAPKWCGVEECLASWPSPVVAPGETVTTQVLEAWVDPDGDPLYLADVRNPTGAGVALSNPDGTITYRHLDSGSTKAQNVPLEVVVSDVQGETSTKVMNVRITPEASLQYDPVVVVGVAGEPVSVRLRDSVRSGQGAIRLVEATAEDEENTDVKPSKSGLSFTLSAEKPGSYPVRVTLEDSASQVTGLARVILLDPEDAEVTTTPVTVFVRPNEDVTVDVLPTVLNPAGHVLLVDNLAYEPAEGAELTANVLGQQYIHATGKTADGEPGKIGEATYQVSDGSGGGKSTATGVITFMLLPDADSTLPIATDRWLTVPAGNQVDFPVLDWAVAPPGAQVSVDATSIVNETEAGLAFGTPTLVRYLAPEEPGEYSIGYTIYRLGDPSLTSTARLHLQVEAPDAESKPRPSTLEGRVLAGQQVAISPDYREASLRGEPIRLTGVVEQPKRGSAALSPDGEKIIYTANPDEKGQDTFTYEVTSPGGQRATAMVKVGILDAQVPATPITFSDYVQMSVGSSSEVSVFPTQNDTDPLGEELELVDVIPNVPPDSREYGEMQRRLHLVDEETGEVRIAAGDQLGTSSFIYTVRGPKGDTATGLIVTKVVRERVPDLPVVTDTILTAETLPKLPNGIDVLDGHVQWFTGDVQNLALSMWDEGGVYRAEGHAIDGPLPDKFTVVPFEVTGTSFLGEESTSYGFMKIPAEKEVPLALRAAFETLEVPEGESGEMDLIAAVATPPDEKLEVDGAGVTASGARPAATCTISGKSTLVYNAGEGAPWQDACTVPVKVEGQEDYTHLTVAIKVIPKEAQPSLLPASISVSPGQTESYDLNQMVEWDGDPVWDSLVFQVSPAGTLFEVTQNGSMLTVRGNDNSPPTRIERVTVALASHPDAGASTLDLVVGPRPNLDPRGGTVVHECSQAGGNTSCVIPVIGAQGQVNPFPQTPLKLVSAISPANCKGVSFDVADGGSVRATWGPDTPGGECRGGFVVEDAQGIRSSGEGSGQIIMDLRGLPSAPAAVEWIGYTKDAVVLAVAEGGTSYPPMLGYVWSGGGKSGKCQDVRGCLIEGLEPGAKTEFTVRSVNEVGESRDGASVTAWAYEAPKKPTGIVWTPVNVGDAGNVVKMSMEPTSDTKELEVKAGGGESRTVSAAEARNGFQLDVGTNTGTEVTAKPISKFDPPPDSVAGGSRDGTSATELGVHGVGAPKIVSVTAEKGTSDTKVTVHANIDSQARGVDVAGEICDGGACRTFTGTQPSETFDIEYGQTKTFTVKAWNVYSGEKFPSATGKVEYGLEFPVPDIRSSDFWVEPVGGSEGSRGFVWDELYIRVEADCSAGSSTYFYGGTKIDSPSRMALSPGEQPKKLEVRCSDDTSWPSKEIKFQGSAPLRITFSLDRGDECPYDAEPTGASQLVTFTPAQPNGVETSAKTTDQGDGTSFYEVLVQLKNGLSFPSGEPGLEGGGAALRWYCHFATPETSDPPGTPDPPETP